MSGLEGRSAIVTGAAQGIGRAIAERLVAEGCPVTITDRRTSVTSVGTEIGAAAFVGDVADPEHVRHVVESSAERDGPVTILVNNAGEVRATRAQDGLDGASELFDRLFGSNTKGAFLFGRAVAPMMVEVGHGDIVNISTDHVKPCPDCDRHHGHGRMDLYNASKWALNGLTFDWSRSLSRHGVRVNNICMGATDTAMLRGFMGREPEPAEAETWMQPVQIAQILVELLAEGRGGRTANSIGLYAGYPCEMPPAE